MKLFPRAGITLSLVHPCPMDLFSKAVRWTVAGRSWVVLPHGAGGPRHPVGGRAQGCGRSSWVPLQLRDGEVGGSTGRVPGSSHLVLASPGSHQPVNC